MGPFFVGFHETTIADDIGCKDCRQTSFDFVLHAFLGKIRPHRLKVLHTEMD